MDRNNVYNVLNWKPEDPSEWVQYIASKGLAGNSQTNPTSGPPAPRRTSSLDAVRALNSQPIQGPQQGPTVAHNRMANSGPGQVGTQGYVNSEPKYQPRQNETQTMPSGRSPEVNGPVGGNPNRSTITGSYAGGGGGGSNTNAANLAGENAGTSDQAQSGEYGSGGAKTPFGQSFAPTSFESIWSNPEIMIQEWLNQAGAPMNTGGAAQTLDLADRMGIMWMLMNNETFGQEGQGSDTADFIDWGGGYVQNMRTPGGAVASTSDVLNQVMAPGENTPMYTSMYNADMRPEEQVNAALSTMQYGLRGVAPALMIQSILSRAQELGRQYQADIATGRDTGEFAHFGDYLRQNGLVG